MRTISIFILVSVCISCFYQFRNMRLSLERISTELVSVDESINRAYSESRCPITEDPDELRSCIYNLSQGVSLLEKTRDDILVATKQFKIFKNMRIMPIGMCESFKNIVIDSQKIRDYIDENGINYSTVYLEYEARRLYGACGTKNYH